MAKIYNMSGQPGMTQQDLNNLAARIARIEKITPYKLGGGSLAPSDFSTIDAAGTVDGKLNLSSSSGLEIQGIITPKVVDGQFSVAKPSDSSAVLYWDGTNGSRVILIRKPDSKGQGLNGTSTTIPGSNITITGLTHDLKYQALPYWSPGNQCGIGFAPGTVGTPQIAFLSTDSDTIFAQGKAIQALMGREPLGNVAWTQPASGGSSGGGNPDPPPDRQPGTCVMVNTNIEPVHKISPWDWKTLNHPEENWRRIITDNLMSLQCTENHPLYDEDNVQREARWFTAGKWILTKLGLQKIADASDFYKDCTKTQVMMKSGHLFWANGFLSHNDKIVLEI